MRFLKYIAMSWTIWGISLYLFSPYLTILLEHSINSNLIGLTYVISSIAGVFLLASLGRTKSREVVEGSLVLSGVGLLLLGLIQSPITSVLGLILYNSYWVAVPFFYYELSRGEKEEFSKAWAISMVPAIILPIIGGMIVLHAGLNAVFVVAGIVMMLSAIPLRWVKFEVKEGEGSSQLSLIPLIFSVLPLSLALPFLYEVRFFELSAVWITYEIGEIVGILITLMSWRIKNPLQLSLLLFSTVFINSFISVGGFYYGLSEALLSVGVESVRPKSYRDAVKVALAEALIWTIGYIVASIVYIINYSLPFIYASLIALLFSLLLLVEIGEIRYKTLTEKALSKLMSMLTSPLYEGIEPYFKFA